MAILGEFWGVSDEVSKNGNYKSSSCIYYWVQNLCLHFLADLHPHSTRTFYAEKDINRVLQCYLFNNVTCLFVYLLLFLNFSSFCY